MGYVHAIPPPPFLHPLGIWAMRAHVSSLTFRLLGLVLELWLAIWDPVSLTTRL